MNIVLVEPEIPPNTGNIARLCVATGARLHLVGRLGFRLTDRHLKRAGLDYWELVEVERHDCFEDFARRLEPDQLLFFSRHGRRSYLDAPYRRDTCLVFGSESKGLPARLRERYRDRLFRIPMLHPGVRSLNLAGAVHVVVYEALRQQGLLSHPERMHRPPST